jgi:hypothetical protein
VNSFREEKYNGDSDSGALFLVGFVSRIHTFTPPPTRILLTFFVATHLGFFSEQTLRWVGIFKTTVSKISV